jgi:hypothetical protein
MAANQNIYKMCQSYPEEQHYPMDNNKLSAFNLLDGTIGKGAYRWLTHFQGKPHIRKA